MVEFFDNLKEGLKDIGKTISEKADVVSKKTEEVVEVQKMKSQIRTLKRGNDRDFRDIGKMIYERFQKGEPFDNEFTELCEAIQERDASIAEYKEKVADLQGCDLCPNCDAHISDADTYCPKCGARLDDEIDEDEFEEE